jgi:hypothetical protein
MRPYLNDEMHISQSDRDKAMVTHLQYMASSISKSAKRFQEGGDLCHSEALHPIHIRDIELQNVIISYINQNYKKIGDISLAHGLIKLVENARIACR